MAKRRGNNEGTVFQDKDGVWWAQLPPDEKGQRPKRRAKTQREAQQKLRQMQRERERNRYRRGDRRAGCMRGPFG